MTKKFYNPYQFIPVTGRINGAKQPTTFDYSTLAKGEDASTARHDLWHKDGLSGSFQCTLALESPAFVGGMRRSEATATKAAEVNHYLRNGLPAIPGNSLRGMVGSVVEALSQSALRVLGNNNYSLREAVKDANGKKVGRIVRKNNSFAIEPLESFTIDTGQANTVFSNGQDYYYGDAENYQVYRNDDLKKNLVKGQLRILDAPKSELPRNRNSELFVYEADPKPGSISLTHKVVKAYEQICEERWEASKNSSNRQPFLFKGWQGKSGREPWRIQEDLLVYYRLDKGNVSELSLSKVWRKNTGTNAHDVFSDLDPMLIPWGSPGREHLSVAERLLGVAEDLSLAIDENNDESNDENNDKSNDKSNDAARNLASRVRFTDALPSTDENFDDWQNSSSITLRILAAPKPPSPAMYFKGKTSNTPPPKKQHLKFSKVTPNGRKYYLHHPEQQIDAGKWQSQTDKNFKQKVQVKPLPAGKQFIFNVEFDNLSSAEVSLLATALCPADSFRYRLGMGRSLGLGQVRLHIEEINFINRKAIYGLQGLGADFSTTDSSFCDLDGLQAGRERVDYGKGIGTEDNQYIDKNTLDILNILGDPSKLKPGIATRPPLTGGQARSSNWEDEGFRWFVHNDRWDSDRQYLKALQGGDDELPTLESRDEGGANRPVKSSNTSPRKRDKANSQKNAKNDYAKGTAPVNQFKESIQKSHKSGFGKLRALLEDSKNKPDK